MHCVFARLPDLRFSWGCNSCVPDEYIEKKKRSVLIDILHLLMRLSIVIDISQFLTTRQERFFLCLKGYVPHRIKTFTVSLNIV